MSGIRNASENLASNGILNFDSNAFVMGTKPEFIGSPTPPLTLPLDEPLPGHCGYGFGNRLLDPSIRMHAQPNADAFVTRGHGGGDGALKGGILAAIAGAIGLAGFLAWSKHDKAVATEAKEAQKAEKVAVKAAKKGKNGVKDVVEDEKIMTKIKSGFEEFVAKVKGYKVPVWAKVAIGGTAAVTVLAGVYKALSTPKQEHMELPEGPPKFPEH